MKMIVSSHAKKTHFHKKGLARSLGLKKRVLELRKFSVLFITLTRLNLLSSLVKITCLFGKKQTNKKCIVSKSTTVDFYSFVVRFC